MFDIFEAYMTKYAAFTREEILQIYSMASRRSVRKRQTLLLEGQVCRHKIFICTGLLRSYRLTDDGNEHIMRFGAENGWMIDHQSYQKQVPSKLNIDAIENSELLFWLKEDVDKISIDIPMFREFSDKVRSETLDATHDRVLANISYTPEEKYNDFVASYPEIFRRVPLHMVASYLGVSRETLTRVRRV
ncbi:MAG: Crp/Fnr family transcriptional regulator [Sphingobacteriaceae bacterium]|nr:MAG: Crp/Fnr family transcriptional regulator [Sphingobacteriaceae bacterium]